MAPKHRNTTPQAAQQAAAAVTSSPSSTPSHAATAPVAASPSGPVSGAGKAASKHQQQSWNQVVANIANYYVKNTPQRTKLIDAFMAFLVAVGALQFLYCILAGNYVRQPRSAGWRDRDGWMGE